MAEWDLLLTDVPAFQWLRLLEEEFGVEFTLYGGAATRLAISMYDQHGYLPDLVSLAPFSSDIDLAHNGPEGLTPLLLQAIDAVVPGAGWCRWSLVSNSGWKRHMMQRAFSAHIPLRSFEFNSARAVNPSDLALNDLAENQISLHANLSFVNSVFYRENLDLEIFSALIALGSAADVEAIRGVTPRGPNVSGFLQRFIQRNDQARLRDSFSLRRRLLYLLGGLEVRWSVSEREPTLWKNLSGLAEIAAPPSGQALALSASLNNETYRLPLSVYLSADQQRLSALDEVVVDSLFKVSALTAPVRFTAGRAPSSGLSAAGTPREFVHLGWRSPADPETKFGALLLGGQRAEAPYAVGGVFPSGYAWVRVDVGNMLKSAPSYLQFALVEASSGEKIEGSPQVGPRLVGPAFKAVVDYEEEEEAEAEEEEEEEDEKEEEEEISENFNYLDGRA